jgi:hypothetical protein
MPSDLLELIFLFFESAALRGVDGAGVGLRGVEGVGFGLRGVEGVGFGLRGVEGLFIFAMPYDY